MVGGFFEGGFCSFLVLWHLFGGPFLGAETKVPTISTANTALSQLIRKLFSPLNLGRNHGSFVGVWFPLEGFGRSLDVFFELLG